MSCLLHLASKNGPFTRIMPYRKRTKKPDYEPVQSSSIPGMTVGEVRKVRGFDSWLAAFLNSSGSRANTFLCACSV